MMEGRIFDAHCEHEVQMRRSLAIDTTLQAGLVAGLLCGCQGGTLGTGGATSTIPVVAAPAAADRAKPRQILYVLVNSGTYSSYVAMYDAYAKNPQVIGKITDGLQNPGAIWLDAAGDIYVGNDMTYTSSVTEYAPGATKPERTFTNGIDLPFGGMVDPAGKMYVSVAGIKGRIEGGIAVFPKNKTRPSVFLTDNVYVPHGVAKDSSGNLFLAQIYGLQSSVIEFPSGSNNSVVLPLNDLNTGAFLEDLKLDAKSDIVVADANLNAVRFYPSPYKKESMALTAGLSAPTALAYGHDGSLFVGNEYVNVNNGNVVVFPPGAKVPARTIVTGITGGVLGVAVGPGP
jgi:hypothetical protein